MTGRYQIKFSGGEISVERSSSSDTNQKLHGSINRNGSQIEFVPNSVDVAFNEFFMDFKEKIICMRLSKKDTNEIFELFGQFIEENMALCGRFFECHGKKNSEIDDILTKTQHYITEKINSVKTVYRRNKQLNENSNYVAPIEKAMGTKWKTKTTPTSDLPDHQINQTIFHVIPIAETLKVLFSNPEFKSMFMEYNNNKHECVDGVYRDFCCGIAGQKDPIFRCKDTVVLQFGIDEFDVCCGLKTKATVHKVLPVYFRIRNIPMKYSSRLDNIYLAALCKSNNFKQTGCSENDVLDEVRRELAIFERDGIDVGNGMQFKVVLFDVSTDNLEANVLFGFARSFSAEFFCRFCECTKAETQSMVTENVSKRRSVSKYQNEIKKLEMNPNLDLKSTKGIHGNCTLNELEHFHVVSHPTIDIMHDVCEGDIPFFLHNFFLYCITNKIANESDLIQRIRDFNYGTLNSANKPSKLCVDRSNLGQNATQLYNIMVHLPFIFIDKQKHLHHVWPIMSSLLQCMRVLFSFTITENDIGQFVDWNEQHLNGMITVFETVIKTKTTQFKSLCPRDPYYGSPNIDVDDAL